ncbi:MAG TPA: hypothetical protein DCQ24_10215 [Bacteroidales bacterium]|nr:hypothetical protein [Bacteroidales bacterium]
MKKTTLYPNIYLVLFFVFMVSCNPPRQSFHEIERVKQESMAHIRFLASDELKGKKPGTPEMKIAARYIVEQFRAYGLQSFSNITNYLQGVPIEFITPQLIKNVSCNNIVGFIEGSDAILKNEYVVLIAHYDHLGVIPDSVNANSDSIYNGARDNGMGITALLYTAKELSKKPPRRSVIFLATTGEEEGMQGSTYFLKNSPVPLKTIVFVLNNDGGGYNDTTLIRIGGKNEINFSIALWNKNRSFGIHCLPYPEEWLYLYKEGDAFCFAEKGIPSITVSPGFDKIDDAILKYIHKPTDEAGDDFNYYYLAKFCQAYYEISIFVANSEKVPF